jgi:ATP-dependent exoDNAse (exonuclease V) beta subunit
MGNVKVSLEQFAEGCRDLMYGRRTGHPDLAPFKNWNEALEWSQDEAASSMAGDVATLIQLVQNITVEQMLKCLAAAVEEKDAEVVISTAHRAKGREWNSVRLAGDFKHPDDMDTADLRLTYVAVTRAKENLDISQFPKSKGDTPPLFNNLGSRPVISNSSTPRKQRPPIDLNRKVNASAPVPKQKGILKRLLGD